jgi:hypothetical protein
MRLAACVGQLWDRVQIRRRPANTTALRVCPERMFRRDKQLCGTRSCSVSDPPAVVSVAPDKDLWAHNSRFDATNSCVQLCLGLCLPCPEWSQRPSTRTSGFTAR